MVIVDHIMPKVDGITFIRRMRATEGHGQIPMVMLTATTDDAVRLAALEAGATDFLSKSQSPVELKVRLRNLINSPARCASSTTMSRSKPARSRRRRKPSWRVKRRWCSACRRRSNTATTTPTTIRSAWRNSAA